jgi:thioesterase III
MTSTSRAEETFRVRSYEIDMYGHVNNAVYLNWLEDGRELILKAGERDYSWYPRENGAYIVVVRLEIDYRAAALAGARIRLVNRIARLGDRSITFRQSIRDADSGLVYARARVVMCFGDGKSSSVPIPDDFRARFAASVEGDQWTDEEGGEGRG